MATGIFHALLGPLSVTDLVTVETLTGTRALVPADGNILYFDPGGDNRDVTLPAEEGTNGAFYLIVNGADAAENLVVKSDAPATIGTIGQGNFGLFVQNEGTWVKVMQWASTGTAGTLIANIISELTAAAGVTIDGLRIKDSAVTPVAGAAAWADLSNCATGEADIIAPAVADAFTVRIGSNAALTLIGTASSEKWLFNIPLSFASTAKSISDPGASGAIPVTIEDGVCNLTTAGAEARSLAIPAWVGQRITVACNVHAGNAVLTVASPFNTTGNNTITFTAAGQSIGLVGRLQAGTRKWVITHNDGATLSTV